MSTFSQNLLSFLFIFLFDSLIAGIVFTLLCYLITVFMVGSSAVSIGNHTYTISAVVGAAYGLTSCLLIFYFNPQSSYASAFVTCLATLILSAPVTFYLLSYNSPALNPSYRVKEIIDLIKIIAFLSVTVSAILFIPSFLVGLLNGKIRSLFLQVI